MLRAVITPVRAEEDVPISSTGICICCKTICNATPVTSNNTPEDNIMFARASPLLLLAAHAILRHTMRPMLAACNAHTVLRVRVLVSVLVFS